MSPTLRPLNPTIYSSRPKAEAPAAVLNLLRDQLSLQTWLLIGAAIQSILFILPIRPTYTIAPVFLALLYTLIDTLLVTFNFKSNSYLAGARLTKFSALIPNKDGSFSLKKDDADEGRVVILLLGVKINHPLGLLQPQAQEIGAHFQAMVNELNENARTNGFLGSTGFLGTDDRTSKSEIMTTFYFSNLKAVEDFALNNPTHRKGWDAWNRMAKEGKNRHIGIYHEVYEAPKGRWENVYLNMQKTGMANTKFLVEGKEGEGWAEPNVDVSRGLLASHKGRTQGLAN